jgi:aspartate ammonia-lyase
MSGEMRIESDLLGEIGVPVGALYGAQTRRAVVNFPLNGQSRMGDWPSLIWGLVTIKQAAARANMDAGFLDARIGEAIIEAGLMLEPAEFGAHFPIHALHGGGGTSGNMNANEVLANLAEERLGGRRGEYKIVHPNDHVNLHQSTNDVYPTACHLAVIAQAQSLDAGLAALAASLEKKIEEFGNQARLARTCLQDAVAVTFADTLGGYVSMLTRQRARISEAVRGLQAVNLGGTIVGRACDAPEAYRVRVIEALREVTGFEGLRVNENLFDGAQNLDDLAAVSAALDLAARSVAKVAQDLRLLSSGPEGGLGEVVLPAVQPGSSIMPGKINPVIPEHAMHLCFRVMGLDAAARQAVNHGELDLNIWESLVAIHVLESMALLESAARVLGKRCVDGMVCVPRVNDGHVKAMMPVLTELAKKHGYSKVSAVCKEAGGDLGKLRGLIEERFGS